ncbi:hypothetical protein, variant 1 [Phytophthora nicotianae P10297]|uniref:Protein ZIP4 homolog n=4 Tax=Phytophthora nicotianae TaxID=4792 RepID=W2Q445_PHYN3|nr:hypothetical protein, variant 1 [Phytophthora nicotianae INRA-310]ETI43583.1 hypothetical protein, variant 1 [Phytophthora nicotianae P1569]ETM43496.1 hypothetical protein, variant 1 [Phytophthora nicotianae]ETN07299.1 hypothetical protein, variant 1 [Phytophthora nicotianae INRA-310]ETP41427.1 hypothetical protein, variant 1 [Phytophthora nicotianae P10297]
MLEEDASTISKYVEAATELLARATEASAEDIAGLNRVLEGLQRIVAGFGKQRVLELSGTQLMNVGVELYNAPRAAMRVLAQIEDNHTDEQRTSFSRYSLALTRFVAAKVMELSLICSKDDGAQEKSGKKSMQFMDECVGVLRSFGRVGMLMLESASIDCAKCEEYLSLAKESFSSSMQLWSRVGLSHLTKFKHGLELEDIVDDLWDFCVDRVRVLQLLAQRSDTSPEDSRDIMSSLHELKMLTPYKTSYASSLLDIMLRVSDDYKHATLQDLQVPFAEEALRIGESLENAADENFPELITSFKQHLLMNLLQSLCASGDIERAEACYQLIPDNRDRKVLLLMNKLYVENKQFEKAHRLLQLLFQQDCFEDSLAGARTFARGFSFSDKGLDIYRELASNYGEADFAINVDIACNLAFVEGKRYEAIDELKRIGCALLEEQRNGQAIDKKHILKVRQTIFDALQEALNSNQHDCLKWADAALATVSTSQDKAMYMRIISRSCIQLGRDSEAFEWAEEAFATEPSKQSLLAVLQAAIEANPEVSKEKLTRTIDQLKARDDFEIDDLLAMGKLASDLGPSRQEIVMLILDELCHTLMETDSFPAKLPVGVVLQNAAQLAFTKFTHRQQNGLNDNAEGSYSEKFLTYANTLLLKSSISDTIDRKESFEPSSIFEWFFRMSFDIAKSTEDSRYFIVAANIAERSDELFELKSPLMQQSQQCLLAAVSSDMKKIDTLDKSRLLGLLEVINRIGCIQSGDTSEVGCYLARADIAVKLRLFNANTEAIFELCKTTQQSVPQLMEIGELVLYATKFNEASEVLDSYRFLAGQVFSYGLQLLIQARTPDSNTLCYLLRRLITLAESKTKAHEWFEHVLQLLDNLDVAFPELEMEWFVAKAWNIGVLYHRGNDNEEALKFMKIAQMILRRWHSRFLVYSRRLTHAYCSIERSEPLVERLGNELNQQYQELLRKSTKSALIE